MVLAWIFAAIDVSKHTLSNVLPPPPVHIPKESFSVSPWHSNGSFQHFAKRDSNKTWITFCSLVIHCLTARYAHQFSIESSIAYAEPTAGFHGYFFNYLHNNGIRLRTRKHNYLWLALFWPLDIVASDKKDDTSGLRSTLLVVVGHADEASRRRGEDERTARRVNLPGHVEKHSTRTNRLTRVRRPAGYPIPRFDMAVSPRVSALAGDSFGVRQCSGVAREERCCEN